MRKTVWLWVLLVTELLTVACGDDDELLLKDQIVGSWKVESYEVTGDPDTEYSISIDRFEFRKDQTFTVYYPQYINPDTGADETMKPESGTYEAGNDYLRLEYTNTQGDNMVLCEVLRFSENDITLKYRHPDSDIVADVHVVRSL